MQILVELQSLLAGITITSAATYCSWRADDKECKLGPWLCRSALWDEISHQRSLSSLVDALFAKLPRNALQYRTIHINTINMERLESCLIQGLSHELDWHAWPRWFHYWGALILLNDRPKRWTNGDDNRWLVAVASNPAGFLWRRSSGLCASWMELFWFASVLEGPRSKVTLAHSKFRLLGRVQTTIDSNPARHHPQKQLRCLQLRSRAKPSLLIDRWSDMRRLTLSICQPGGSPKWIKMVERLGTLGWSLGIH